MSTDYSSWCAESSLEHCAVRLTNAIEIHFANLVRGKMILCGATKNHGGHFSSTFGTYRSTVSSTHGSRQVKEKDVGKFEPNEQGLV